MAGAGSTSSSLTSTSHTLTYAPGMAPLSSKTNATAALAFLDSFKPDNRHAFLQPPTSIPTASLQLAKDTLDAFAGQVADEQQHRLEESRKKRKRGAQQGVDPTEILKIRKLHVDGFDTGQIWQQAKRIISSTLLQSQEALRELEESDRVETAHVNGDAEELDLQENGVGAGSGHEESDSSSEGSSADSDQDAKVSDGEADDLSELDQESEGSLMEEDEVDDEDQKEDDEDLSEPTDHFTKDPDGLNDGFFSIDDFNKQSQWLEDQDARANPNTDQLTDEEDMDWHADPMSEPVVRGRKKSEGAVDEDESLASDDGVAPEQNADDDDEDDDGPTFGNMDLFAPEGASEDEMDGDDGGDFGLDLTANDIFYKDFFTTTAKKKKKKSGYRPSATLDNAHASQPDDVEVERAMNIVRRDLFEDNSEHSDSEDALSDVSAGNPKSRRSAHERRQAKVLEEIRKLEAEAVKEKKWTLAGEAAASIRPKDSLLEEDLDFEYAGKPVPIVTQEINESMEDMIKRRIINKEFDEVLRRYPGAGDVPGNTRRGLVEIDDAKGKQSLAELYEEDHVKANNPDTYVSKSEEKLKKEEQEVERMWKDVCGKLDALSSWHYRPKPAASSLTVIADVATVAMEDAQPATAQGVGGGENMMAPQEIYQAGKESAEKGEVVVKSGLPVARQEMSREDKLRRRRRQKERIRKSGDGNKPVGKKAEAIATLKRGGVRVINRKGEVVDASGNKMQAAKPLSSASFKL